MGGWYRGSTATSQHQKTKLVELIERINDEITKLDFNGACEYIKKNYGIDKEYKSVWIPNDTTYSLIVDTPIEIKVMGNYNRVKLELIKKFNWDAGKDENRNVAPNKSGKSELEIMLDALRDVEKNKFHFNETINFFKTNYPNLREQKPILCDREYFGKIGCQDVLIKIDNSNKSITTIVSVGFEWTISKD